MAEIENKTISNNDVNKNEINDASKINDVNRKSIVSRDKMMEAGIHFGHRTAQWNPKMKHFISLTKKGVHLIDLQKTMKSLEFAYGLIKKNAERGADFIFVGTKKQSKATIKENAIRTKSYYMSERWLGGTLTNNRTIFQRVKRMFHLERLQEKGFEGYTKKEGVLFTKELVKLQKNLSGIRDMRRKPSVMIVADIQENLIAIKEAKKLGMRVVGVVDTNDDPTLVDVAIPANNDSVKSATLVITILADAIAATKNEKVLFAYQDDNVIVLPDELKREFKPRRRFNNDRSNFRRRDSGIRTFAPKTIGSKENTKVSISDAGAKSKETPSTTITDKSSNNDFSKLTIEELKKLVQDKNLKVDGEGVKADLIAALKGAK